ncbi:7577_t:CDS:2, partial [Scutellospora calospora]
TNNQKEMTSLLRKTDNLDKKEEIILVHSLVYNNKEIINLKNYTPRKTNNKCSSNFVSSTIIEDKRIIATKEIEIKPK